MYLKSTKTLASQTIASRRLAMPGNLPNDLLIDILSRLPVKSLLRFRCVCRSWCNLFTDANFINMHLNQTSNKSYLLLKHQRNISDENYLLYCDKTFVEYMKLELPFKRSAKNYHVVGSCNGLVCLSDSENSHFGRNIYLWNPSIRMFKALPNSDIDPILVFLGFGFIHRINDYKVVRVITYDFEVPHEVEIYSMNTNSWKRIGTIAPCLMGSSWSMALLNGAVHWLAYVMREPGHYHHFILSVDLGEEVVREINLPDQCVIDDKEDLLNLVTVFKESLSLIVFRQDGGILLYDIWVMKEYGKEESWTKPFTIELRERCFVPIKFMSNGEVLLCSCGDLFLYDQKVQQAKDLPVHGVSIYSEVCSYTESLVLLGGGNEVAVQSNDAYSSEIKDGVDVKQ